MATYEETWEAASGQMQQREYARARELFVECVRLAADEEQSLSARALVARMDSATKDVPAARSAIDAVLADAAGKSLAPRVEARIRQIEAIVTREEGQREAATQKFIGLYEFCVEHELWDPAIDAAHHVAIAADPETQVLWAHKGIAAAEAGDRKGWLAALWNNLGATLEGMNRPAEVLEAYEKAREYHYLTGGPLQKLIADWAVGRAWRMNGDPKEAQRWLEASLEVARERYAADPTPAAAEWIAYGLQELGRVARLAGEKELALQLFESGRERWVEAGLETWVDGTAEYDAELADLRAELERE